MCITTPHNARGGSVRSCFYGHHSMAATTECRSTAGGGTLRDANARLPQNQFSLHVGRSGPSKIKQSVFLIDVFCQTNGAMCVCHERIHTCRYTPLQACLCRDMSMHMFTRLTSICLSFVSIRPIRSSIWIHMATHMSVCVSMHMSAHIST